MKSPEPVTAVTDYLLAAVYLAFALRLLSRGCSERQISLQLAAATFFSTFLGALAGGTYHLIGGQILWKATIYWIGLGGFLMVASAASHHPNRGWLAALSRLLGFERPHPETAIPDSVQTSLRS